jgi:hypothetical protein
MLLPMSLHRTNIITPSEFRKSIMQLPRVDST